jgi:hypothetical protein
MLLACVVALVLSLTPANDTQIERPSTTDASDKSFNPLRHTSKSVRRHFAYEQPAPQTVQAVQAAATEPKSEPKVLDHELVVTLKSGVTNIDEIAAFLDAQVAGRIEKLNAYRLQFDHLGAAVAARDLLQANTEVEAVDANYQIPSFPAGQEFGPSSTLAFNLTVKPGDSGGKIVVGLIDSAVQLQSAGPNKSLFLPSISVAGDSTLDPNALTHGTSTAEAILQGLSMMEVGENGSSVRILPVDGPCRKFYRGEQ